MPFKTLVLFAALAATVVAPSAAPAEHSSMADYFVGWYPSSVVTGSDSWGWVTCDHTLTWATSSDYGRCCEAPRLDCATAFATSCSDSTLFYPHRSPWECSQGNFCQKMTVYESGSDDQPKYNIFCSEGVWDHPTVFRYTDSGPSSTMASSTTAAPTAIPSSDPSSTPSPAPSITSHPIPTATTPVTQEESGGGGGGGGGGSQAWIAGAVVGPVAGCAILAALGFWLFRRGAKKGRDAAVSEAAMYAAAQSQPQPSPMTTSTYHPPKDADRPLSELPSA